MRYIRGGSLRQTLEQRGAFSLSQTVAIFNQLADALHVAHSAGVIHRDLKPDNVLLDERGQVYLTDFGIAKQLDSAEAITSTNEIIGTFAYLSPEQLRSEVVQPQSDIYALGIMVFELLTGEYPYSGSGLNVVMQHLQSPFPLAHSLLPDLPSDIDHVLQRATAKFADERYKTTLDMAEDFMRAVEGERIPYYTPEHPQPKSPIRPNPQGIAFERRTPAQSSQRHRYYMLQAVRKFWIDGVLKNSLQDDIAFESGGYVITAC